MTQKEVRAVLEEKVIHGRADARVGGIVFELKQPSVGIEAAIADTKRRVAEAGKWSGRGVWGVAYDGAQLAFVGTEGELIGQVQTAAKGAVRLQSWLISLGAEVATVEDFVNRLGAPSELAQLAIEELWNLFQKYRKTVGFIDEVFTVWRSLYGLTTNLNDDAKRGLRRSAPIRIASGQEHEYLFVLETYLALLLKLLVARVAVQQGLTNATSVVELVPERGSYVLGLRGLGQRVPNLQGVFEQDVFLWPADVVPEAPEVARQLDDIIRRIAATVDDVDLVGASEDFLRQVYQRFLDPVSRRSLGEFYTSKEIVQETMDAVGFDGDRGKRVVDISCGSGAFLLEAIDRVIARNGISDTLLADITSNIQGIDIHPFAVAMARVNYLIAVARLLPQEEPFNIPVYWADSLTRLREYGDKRQMAGARKPIAVPIAGLGTFTMPDPEEVTWDDFLQLVGQAVEEAERFQRGRLNVENVWRQFTAKAGEERWARWTIWEDTLKGFVGAIVKRHNENRDMRWLPLLRNSLVVERLVGSCDYVVGNPPWVRIHNISKEIRDRLFTQYQVCRDAGWKMGAKLGHGGRGFGRQVDYSLAFVERALEFLRSVPAGKLGYVITSKWVHALYGNALRKELAQNHRLMRLTDYSLQARPLFEDATNYPLIMAVEKGFPRNRRNVDVTVAGPDGGRLDFQVDQQDLQVIAGDKESPWVLVPPGVRQAFEKMQKGRFYRKLLGQIAGSGPQMGVKTSANDIYIIKHWREVPDAPGMALVETEGYSKVADSDKELYQARIETSVLRPLVRGRDVEAWKYKVQDSILWTHDDVTGKVFQELPPRAQEYFGKHNRRLAARDDYKKGMPAWTIFRTGQEKLGGKVAWQELSHQLGAVYVPGSFALKSGELATLVPLQTVYLVSVPSAEVGYIVAGLFNSLPVRGYTSGFAERARGAYFRSISWVVGLIPVPQEVEWLLSDGKSVAPALKRVLEISQSLHENSARSDRGQLETELDGEVGKLYGLGEADMRALRDYLAFIRRKEPTAVVVTEEEGE
ncbi:MAG: SAM-dependent DNA methyltransferase [Chloroflexi bacterium]|nr:SAM-dependent DNA methyltransferase [Chloroflexota bacterium]